MFFFLIVPSIIGFENTMYEVGEGDGVVEICVAILEPVDSLTLDSTYEAFINVFSLNDSAQGNTNCFVEYVPSQNAIYTSNVKN